MAKRKSAKSKTPARSNRSARSKKSTTSQKPNKTIGILHSGTAGRINDKSIKAFIDELANNGYKVNQNLTLDPKAALFSNDDPTLLASNADKLAGNSGLDLIIAAGGPPSVYTIQTAQSKARTNTNVVFTSFSQLTSPALNMTGVDARTSDLDPMRLTKLYNLVHPQWPDQTTFGVLENDTREDYDRRILEKVAAKLKIRLNRVSVTPGPNKAAIVDVINQAFKGWKQAGITVALVAADPLFNDLRPEVIKAEKAYGFAAMHQWHEFKDEGGYASYGTDLIEAYKKAGTIAGQVLNGNDLAEIPVQPLTNIALAINRTTAKQLGLKAPIGST
jgi:putative tryptophan/tyrosine transport system substrate-binding protein